MTDLYLKLLAEYAARDQAYTLLAALGVGLVLAGFSLHYLLATYFPAKLAAKVLRLYAGGILILYLVGLVILPMVKLD